jgi:hypothetical protein
LLDHRLRDQQSIEWIPMVERKLSDACGMPHGDRHYDEPVLRHLWFIRLKNAPAFARGFFKA